MQPIVCFVVPNHWELVNGGAQYQIRLLIRHARECGGATPIRIVLIVENAPLKTDSQENYETITLNNGSWRWLPYWCKRVLFSLKLYRALKATRPDAIYQRVGCSYSGVCAYYSRRSHSRFVWHIAHDHDLQPLTQPSESFNSRGLWDRMWLKYARNNAGIVITQTYQQKRALNKLNPHAKSRVIRNFQMTPELDNEKARERIILWVSNFREEKRPEEFIDFAKYSSRYLPSFSFVMIGAPSTDLIWQKELEQKMLFSPNFTYMRAQPHAATLEIMRESFAIINTSSSEGFPNTFIDAWSSGLPVVSFFVDPDNMIAKNALGIAGVTYDETIHFISHFAARPDDYVQLSKRCIQHARLAHGEKNASQILKLLLD